MHYIILLWSEKWKCIKNDNEERITATTQIYLQKLFIDYVSMFSVCVRVHCLLFICYNHAVSQYRIELRVSKQMDYQIGPEKKNGEDLRKQD